MILRRHYIVTSANITEPPSPSRLTLPAITIRLNPFFLFSNNLQLFEVVYFPGGRLWILVNAGMRSVNVPPPCLQFRYRHPLPSLLCTTCVCISVFHLRKYWFYARLLILNSLRFQNATVFAFRETIHSEMIELSSHFSRIVYHVGEQSGRHVCLTVPSVHVLPAAFFPLFKNLNVGFNCPIRVNVRVKSYLRISAQ